MCGCEVNRLFTSIRHRHNDSEQLAGICSIGLPSRSSSLALRFSGYERRRRLELFTRCSYIVFLITKKCIKLYCSTLRSSAFTGIVFDLGIHLNHIQSSDLSHLARFKWPLKILYARSWPCCGRMHWNFFDSHFLIRKKNIEQCSQNEF